MSRHPAESMTVDFFIADPILTNCAASYVLQVASLMYSQMQFTLVLSIVWGINIVLYIKQLIDMHTDVVTLLEN